GGPLHGYGILDGDTLPPGRRHPLVLPAAGGGSTRKISGLWPGASGRYTPLARELPARFSGASPRKIGPLTRADSEVRAHFPRRGNDGSPHAAADRHQRRL